MMESILYLFVMIAGGFVGWMLYLSGQVKKGRKDAIAKIENNFGQSVKAAFDLPPIMRTTITEMGAARVKANQNGSYHDLGKDKDGHTVREYRTPTWCMKDIENSKLQKK